jgi:hypothetical protein
METQNGSADPSAVNTSNPLPVGGAVGDGTADSGNSVKAGGVYFSATQTYSSGQRVPLQLDVNGNLKVNIVAGAAAGGTSSAFSAAFPATGTAVGFLNSTGTLLSPGNLDSSGNLKVNIAAGGGSGGTASSFAASFPAIGTAVGFKDSAGTTMAAGNLDASGNLKVNVSAGSISAVTDNNSAFTNGSTQGLPLALAYNDSASAVSSGLMGIVRMTTNRQMRVVVDAATNGGLTPDGYIAPATPAVRAVKASAGQIGFIHATNNTSSPVYLKVFNVASGSVTLGATAATFQFEIPANTQGAGFTVALTNGLSLTTAITTAVTGGMSLTDNTSISASTVSVTLGYA